MWVPLWIPLVKRPTLHAAPSRMRWANSKWNRVSPGQGAVALESGWVMSIRGMVKSEKRRRKFVT